MLAGPCRTFEKTTLDNSHRPRTILHNLQKLIIRVRTVVQIRSRVTVPSVFLPVNHLFPNDICRMTCDRQQRRVVVACETVRATLTYSRSHTCILHRPTTISHGVYSGSRYPTYSPLRLYPTDLPPYPMTYGVYSYGFTISHRLPSVCHGIPQTYHRTPRCTVYLTKPPGIPPSSHGIPRCPIVSR